MPVIVDRRDCFVDQSAPVTADGRSYGRHEGLHPVLPMEATIGAIRACNAPKLDVLLRVSGFKGIVVAPAWQNTRQGSLVLACRPSMFLIVI